MARKREVDEDPQDPNLLSESESGGGGEGAGGEEQLQPDLDLGLPAPSEEDLDKIDALEARNDNEVEKKIAAARAKVIRMVPYFEITAGDEMVLTGVGGSSGEKLTLGDLRHLAIDIKRQERGE